MHPMLRFVSELPAFSEGMDKLCVRWPMAEKWLGAGEPAEHRTFAKIRAAWALVLGVCWQSAEPFIWHSGCPAVGVGGLHSDGYSEDGEWLCQWCGARPAWPVHWCDEPVDEGWWGDWPHLCTGWVKPCG